MASVRKLLLLVVVEAVVVVVEEEEQQSERILQSDLKIASPTLPTEKLAKQNVCPPLRF